MILTAAQIEAILKIIRDSSTALSVSTMGLVVTKEELDRLVRGGYLRPEDLQGLQNVVRTAFELGRLQAALPKVTTMTWPEAQGWMERHPVELTDQEQLSYEIASERAGAYCRGLGSKLEGQLPSIITEVSESRAEDMRAVIREEVSEAVAERKTSSELTTKLREATEDWDRDWKRTARTEIQLAHEQGYVEHLRKRGGDEALMAKIPSHDACPKCLELYLDGNGRPAVHPISWWDAQGVNNVGRKQKEWKACTGAVHPWCRCAAVSVPAGWGFDDGWDLVPLPVEEGEETTEKSMAGRGSTVEKKLETRKGQLIKAQGFGGVVGLVGTDRPVGTMGTVGNPPKQRSDFAAHLVEGSYADPKLQKKKKRRLVLTRHAKDIQSALPFQPGMVRDKPCVPQRLEPTPEDNRRRFDQREQDRQKNMARPGLRPQDLR